METWMGIDLGGKSNGNTAACYNENSTLYFVQFGTSKNYHQSLVELINQYPIQTVFIDAPLSLPGVYSGLKGFTDFHKRQCDVRLKAMSPMFLGGFTANAMAFNHQLKTQGVNTVEVYPKALVEALQLKGYSKKLTKKELPALTSQIMAYLTNYTLKAIPASLHELDALLTWCSGYRYHTQLHKVYGHPKEGRIVV